MINRAEQKWPGERVVTLAVDTEALDVLNCAHFDAFYAFCLENAEGVGHPWMADERWGTEGAVEEFGVTLALFVVCCLAAGAMVVVAVATAPVWIYRKLRGEM